MKHRKTKQGVRDLNNLPSKPRGIRLELPPSENTCDPRKAREDFDIHIITCGSCGAVWDIGQEHP
jgi:hypothetical protein